MGALPIQDSEPFMKLSYFFKFNSWLFFILEHKIYETREVGQKFTILKDKFHELMTHLK